MKATQILATLFVLAFAFICLVAALIMPGAELGSEIKNLPPALGFLGEIYNSAQSMLPTNIANLKSDSNFQYYVYSFFLGIAMTAAAIALCITGCNKTEEEKTILPVKK